MSSKEPLVERCPHRNLNGKCDLGRTDYCRAAWADSHTQETCARKINTLERPPKRRHGLGRAKIIK